jgi:hypothetical protein
MPKAKPKKIVKLSDMKPLKDAKGGSSGGGAGKIRVVSCRKSAGGT